MSKATEVNIPGSALVVLVGAAGAGKSTFANSRFRPTEILSSDQFRAMVSDDQGDQEATEDAFLLFHLVLEKRLRRGKLCVADATNLRADHRAKLLNLASLYKRSTLAIVFDTPEEMCIERAGQRLERTVSAAIVREQWQSISAQIDEELLREGFSKVVRLKPEDRLEIRRSAPAGSQAQSPMQSAFTVWLTGLSGSGKSTLARALSEHLTALAIPHQVLDGDELRRTLCSDLGFSKHDRDENVKRIAAAASGLNQDNTVAIVAAIAPYKEARSRARAQCQHFVEIFVDCSLETLLSRDPKGLYRRALAGEIQNFSGVSDPYEEPEHPDIHIHSGAQTIPESVEHLLSELARLGYLPKQA